MLFIILLSLLMMVLALLLFIPCTYTVRIEIRAPFRLYCRVSWLQHGLYWSWDYTFGQRPQRELYLGWHAWPPQAAPAEANACANSRRIIPNR